LSEQCDVIILGTGAAGLTAALAAAHEGASVRIYEKSELIGGTTAMSGGIIWIPNNHLQEEAGVEDSREKALSYLESLSLGQIDSDMAATFVDVGPRMLKWIEDVTPCSFHLIRNYPDYHPEHPGGLPTGGRSVDNSLFSLPKLGEWASLIRGQEKGSPVMLTETPLGGATSTPDRNVLKGRIESGQIGMGLSLISGLLRALLDLGIEPKVNTPATKLLSDEAGVKGVQIKEGDEYVEVIAEKGVVIATGGFEWNSELVRTFLRGPMNAPAGSPENTGDGLQMAMNVGAKLGNMRNAWWVPVVKVPGEMQYGYESVRLILLERTRPHSFMVNRYGIRFTNEAGNYNAMGGVFHAFDPQKFEYPNNPSWLIFDHKHKTLYDVAGCPAGDRVPEWMIQAETAEELAELINVEPDTFKATFERFNEFAAKGEDPDFNRGESAYDTFNGDQSQEGIRATLQPLILPPYYAIKVEGGALGTNGGPKTDATCRVLSLNGGVINGLYAAGNAMAAPTGMVYGGAGGTIGPAMTFGYIAGKAAANR
jgi:succinate dehydrogenase/fumarate reductase flavoprotein subunit